MRFSSRGQSETVGIVFFTGVVIAVATVSGGVILLDLQSDTTGEPLADIDSNLTETNLTLEHLGGDTLDGSEVKVVLRGADKRVTLETKFEPGNRIEKTGFDLAGSVDVVVVHEPSGTVLHENNFQIDFDLEINNRADLVYLLDGYAVNYTAPDGASVTVENESLLDVDNSNGTIVGDSVGNTTVAAKYDGSNAKTDVTVLDADQNLSVETISVTPKRATAANATGNLTNLDDLPDTDLYFESIPKRFFNEQPANNSDDVIADGTWRTDPGGYTHDEYYVHDNRPLQPGETRTYQYYNPGSGSKYEWELRTAEQSNPTGYDIGNDVYTGGNTDLRLPDGAYRIEVTLSQDANTLDVVLYDDVTGGESVYTETGVDVSSYTDRYTNLYFSTYEYDKDYGAQSVRLTDIYGTEPMREQIRTGVDTVGRYTGEVAGFEPGTHVIRAYAEKEISGTTVADVGDEIEIETVGPTVETLSTEITDATSANLTGDLVDIGDLQEANLSFEYVPQRLFNEQPANNSDNVIADGTWRTDPGGYTHDEYYVHDNRPLQPGETRYYRYYNPGSGSKYEWELRTAEQSNPTGYDIGNDVYTGGNTDLRLPDGAYRIEVTLSQDANTLDVVLYDDVTGGESVYTETDIDVSSYTDRYTDLYFSTYEYDKDYGAQSVRLTDIYEDENRTQFESATGVTTEQEFTSELTGLDPDTGYTIRAYTEQVVDNITVTDTAGSLEINTTGPTVETLSTEITDATSANVTGDLVDIGDLQEANLSFEYVPQRLFNEQPANNSDDVIADGTWRTDPGGYTHDEYYVHDNTPLTPGETRYYRYYNPGSGSKYEWELRTAEQSNPTGYDIGNDVYTGGNTDLRLPDDAYRIEVTLSNDTDTLDVVLYDDVTGGESVYTETDIDVSSYTDRYTDLYFSTYEYDKDYGAPSVRLTDIYENENRTRVDAATGVTTEGEFTTELTGLDPDTGYTVRAYTEQVVDGITVSDTADSVEINTTGPTVQTLSTEITDATSANVTGELVDMGDLQEANLSFEYVPQRLFNEQPANNSDDVIADGTWQTNPGGYTHDEDYVHDNRPLQPGETRYYRYYNPGSGSKYEWVLRDGEQQSPTGYDIGNDVYTGGNTDLRLPDDAYRIEVTLSQDANTLDVVLYDDVNGGKVVYNETGVDVSSYTDRYTELYFSTYEYDKDYGAQSVRLTDIYEDENRTQVDAATGVTTEREFTTELTGLDPDTGYTVRAHTEQVVDGITVADTADSLEINTTGPTVETLSTEITDATSANLTGDLVDIGDLQEANLSFEYVPQRLLNEQPANNSDNVIADGTWQTNPGGYTHDEDYVHDNRPLQPGETRYYRYYNPGSNSKYEWKLRTAEQSNPTGYDIGNDVYTGGNTDLRLPDDAYRIEVTLSNDTDTLDVVLYDDVTGGESVYTETDIDVSSYTDRYTDLYFSTYEYDKDYGAPSVRLTDIYENENRTRVEAATGVETEGEFTTELTGLDPDTGYTVRAYTEQVVDNITVSDTADSLEINTTGPTVETLDATPTGATSANVTGDLVDIGDLQEANLSFEYVPQRLFNEQPANNSDDVIADGTWRTDPGGYTHDENYVHDNRPLQPGETRYYRYYNPDSGSKYEWVLRDGEQPSPTGYDIGNDVYTGGNTDLRLPDDAYRIEVTLSNDTDTLDVVLYDDVTDGKVVYNETGVDVSSYTDRYTNLYFSTYEYDKDYGAQSVRLTDIYEDENRTQIDSATGVETEQEFTTELTGLDPDTGYTVRAHTEQVVDNITVTDTAGSLEINTTGPTVETLNATPTGATSANVTGDLVDIGDLQEANLSFEYVPQRLFNEQPANNSDNVIADGTWQTNPGGYTHDEDYVHDNTPLTPGETRYYRYYNPGSGSKYEWVLRNGEQPSPTGYDIGNDVYTGGNTDLRLPDDAYRIEVTLSNDTNTLDVVLYDDVTGGKSVYTETGIDVSSYGDLYFSTYEYDKDYGAPSVRLTGIYEDENRTQVDAATGVTTEGEFSTNLTGLDPDTGYTVRAHTEQVIDNITVSDTGDILGFETSSN